MTKEQVNLQQQAVQSLTTLSRGMAQQQQQQMEKLVQANAVLKFINTSLSTQMATLMSQIQALQQQMANMNVGQPLPSAQGQGGGSAGKPHWQHSRYCWMHRHCLYTIKQCKSKAKGHQDKATVKTMMGGSTFNV